MKTTWKQVVYDTAEAYREATGASNKIPVGQLPGLIRQGTGGGGSENLDAELTLQETLLAEQSALLEGRAVYDVQEVTLDPVPEGSVHEFFDFVANKVTLNPFQGNTGLYVWKKYDAPNGYVGVEYVQSTGSQCIKTRYKPNSNTRVVLDVEVTNFTASGALFAARDSNYTNMYGVTLTGDSKVRNDFGTTTKEGSANVLVRTTLDKNKNVLFFNGITVTNDATTFQTTKELVFLGLNDAGTVKAESSAKIYSGQVYENDTLKCNYEPRVDANGVAGLYDTINNTFDSSATSYALEYGEKVGFLGFVVSDDSSTYPNNGLQGEYWYEPVEEGFDFASILKYKKCSVSTFAFSSRTAVNNAVTHPFTGDIPYFAMIAAKTPSTTNSDLYLAVGIKNLEANSGTLNMASEFYYSSSQTQMIARSTSAFGANRNATGNIFIDSNSIYYAAGVEYYLIVAL